MSERFTRKDVDSAARLLASYAEAAGATDVSRWAVREGSPTYGRGWLLISVDPVTGGQETIAYLGWTAREAYTTVAAMRHVLGFVRTPESVL